MPKPTFFNLPEDKRALILNLAIEEFASHDYHNASVSNIVARAEIAKGSLYQYFADKRDLYFYLLQLATEEKKRFLLEAEPPHPDIDVFEYLRWLVRAGARFELSNPLLAQVAYRALFSDRPFGDEPFEAIRHAALDYYEYLVQTGIEQGSIDPQIDRGLAVFLLASVFNEFGRYLMGRLNVDPQALASGELDYRELPIEEQTDRLIDILARGLGPRNASERAKS